MPLTLEKHGDRREDPYFWLRERENPKVRAYLEAENAYAAESMRALAPLERMLFAEMKSRVPEVDSTVPYRVDAFEYYKRTEAGREYAIHCRRKPGWAEEIILDENQLAEGSKFFHLGSTAISPDHQILAYAFDVVGNERHAVRFRELGAGRELPDRIENVGDSLVFAEDGKTIFYTILDDANRSYKLMRHELGATKDEEVYHEKDDAFFITVQKSRSRRFIFVALQSQAASEWRYIDAKSPRGKLRVIEPRRTKIEYSVEHQGERFLILTNDGAVNFRLVEAPVARPSHDAWRELMPASSTITRVGVEAFRHHLVILEREGGLPHIRVRDLRGGAERRVPMPEETYSILPSMNLEMDTDRFRFEYSSLTTPKSVIEYDMARRTMTTLKEERVLGGFERTRYRAKRIMAESRDGTPVPVSLVYRDGTPRDGSAPLLLEGYGAYGSVSDPRFQSRWLSLLDRGFVIAIAHVRGGGEMGRVWYEDGKLKNKKHTFEDFIGAAEALIRERWTSPAHLAIEGRSAGGLLIGSVVNMRPELFRVALAGVPFVDLLSTMLDPSLPLTVIEYEEWGNPNDPDDYAYMRTYSPYDNVAKTAYPAMLITAGLHDSRVSYWEPAKWAARLRAMKTDGNLLLLKTDMGSGHGGVSGRYQALEEEAFRQAFLISQLGVSLR